MHIIHPHHTPTNCSEPPNNDTAVASPTNLSNVRVDADQDIDQTALDQAVEKDSKIRERHKKKTAQRFNGAAVEVRKGLQLYKINDDPAGAGRGDRFDRTEIAKLQALIRVTKHGKPFLDEMLEAYHPERNNDDNHWCDIRGLQGWLSGRKYIRQLRRGGFETLRKPASAYCARLAIAATPELLRPLEIHPIGAGQRAAKKKRTCQCCRKRLAVLCKKCGTRDDTPRKPAQAETGFSSTNIEGQR